jgi:hypothetical protein
MRPPSRFPWSVRSILLPLLLCLAWPDLAKAAKTDIVILTNGDKVTGEIKRLEAGILQFSTDAMGTVPIEWRFIRQIISDKTQSVETTKGRRLIGRMQKPETGEGLLVETASGSIELDRDMVVAVWPVEASFWDRATLDVSAGFDYARATEISNFNLAADFRHRTEDRFTDVMARANLNRQGGGEDLEELRRAELSGQHSKLLPNRRYRTWFGKVETNEALGVDLRVYAGGGIGKYLVKTNSTQWQVTGGLLATHEIPDEGQSSTNLEALGNLRYRYFRFADPERSVDTTLAIFPSITDFGRVRADFRNTFKLEFWSDLFWALELYANYDSDPIALGAEELDYGVVTSVGYSF